MPAKKRSRRMSNPSSISQPPRAPSTGSNPLDTVLPPLRRLVEQRVRSLEALAPTLSRVSPSNPHRSKIETARTKRRKALKTELRHLEFEISALVSRALLGDAPHTPSSQKSYPNARY